MKYKCLIVDDNMLDLDALQMYLSKIDTIELVATCNDGLEVSKILQEKEIDIIFSDIDMPEISGLALLQSLRNPPVFIFVSAFAEHAAESYNLDVIDFIVKPVKLDRLLKATNKAIEYIELKKSNAANTSNSITNNSIENNINKEDDYFFIKENQGLIKINFDDVIYIESMGNFSKIHTIQQKKHLILIGLKSIETQLPTTQFLRIHKQYVINLKHIVSLSNNNDIHLTDNNTVPLSAVYKPILMEVINDKIINRII